MSSDDIRIGSEIWDGGLHPVQALWCYRERAGIATHLVGIEMTSNGSTIADPNDPGMLVVGGFDPAAPAAVSGFARES